MTFAQLGLSEKVLAAVEASGYNTPTPIQERAIPDVLARRDVLGIAQTGTGKTAAFTLPMLTLLERGRARARMPRTLILEPTRELAAQVEQSFNKYGQNHRLSVALLIGGLSFGDQDVKLTRGVDVLIATPGRLLDHFERGRLLLTGIEVLVIDEADRMLDMGFIPDIERICKLIPPTRQTLFFTATMPPEIQRLTETFLRNPVRIEVARPATTAVTVTQRLVATGEQDYAKREMLRRLIRGAEGLKNAIIFCNRKRDVAVLQRSLARYDFKVGALHGDMDQRARMAALEAFRTGDLPLLVASDVAARGLDIPDVSHVFNYDVPIHADDYVHRIGRTGRAGRLGAAFTLVAPSDGKFVQAIEKLTGQAIPYAEGYEKAPVLEREDDDERPARRGDRRGGRDRGQRRDEARAGGRQDHAAEPARNEPRRDERRPSRKGDGDQQRNGQAAQAARSAETPRQEPSRRNDRPRRGGWVDNDPPVVGLGDHVPDFLLRPVPLRKRA